MPTRGEMKVWKPKRSDAFALCEELTFENCTCRATGKNPCNSWVDPLRGCHVLGYADHAKAERERMESNRRNGTFYRCVGAENMLAALNKCP